jgi:rhodanese-related sulfurtransferase
MIRKRRIITILLFSLAILTFIEPTVNSIGLIKRETSFLTISVSEAHELIMNSTGLFILDVRTQEEFNDGHIEGAYLIPHTEIQSRVAELPINTSDPILVYCRSGGRSAEASQTLIDLGFQNIFNMDGGILDWENAGYDVVVDETTTESTPEESTPLVTTTNTNLTNGFELSLLFIFLVLLGTPILRERKR